MSQDTQSTHQYHSPFLTCANNCHIATLRCWSKTGVLPSVEEVNRLEQEQNGFNEESTLLQNLIDRLPYGEKLTAEGMFKAVSLYESLKNII